MTGFQATCSVFRTLPSSKSENPAQGFGEAMVNVGISWSEAIQAINRMTDAREAVEREERLRIAPELLRQVVAQHLNDDMRALVWGIANDLEEHLSEDEIVEHEEDQAWHVEWTRKAARQRRTGS